MDPVSAVGVAAASLQFVGVAAKGLLGTIKLISDIKDAPDELSQLVRFLDREISSTNKIVSPDSQLFQHQSVEQYVQISPAAIEARKALEDVQKVLQPLADELKLLDEKRRVKRVRQLWKSVKTIKVMKDLKDKMDMVERLNASLLRELQVSGFETQALLR